MTRRSENFVNRKLGDIDDERLALQINGQMDRFRPKWQDFEGKYTMEEMQRDYQAILDYQEKKHIAPEEERRKLKDGLLVEKLFMDSEMADLFAEEIDDEFAYDTLMTDDEDHFLATIPAHPYDDYFNNVDIICSVKNGLTGHDEVVFAVDCTSNPEKVSEKMGYLRTEEQIPGFTEVKYFHDTAKVGKDPLPTGGLEKIPRFVVGFDAELAKDLVKGEDSNGNPWQQAELEQKRDRARYYILTELYAQAKGKDKRLEEYFKGLLDNFVQKRGADTVDRYPGDAVLSAISPLDRGKRTMRAAYGQSVA